MCRCRSCLSRLARSFDRFLALLDLIHALGHDKHHLDRILADILDHLVEHIEALKTVLDNGIVLTV